MATGVLALVGGSEFLPGNEPQDRLLIARRGAGPAYVLATAAARQRPDRAVATAQRWFHGLALDVVELPALSRTAAAVPSTVAQAEAGGFFYLTGGDPGLVVDVLHDRPVWQAVVAAWRNGAALAGSSAGAMALGEWTLLRRDFPGHTARRAKPALGVVPGITVAPHFDTFGHRWVESVFAAPPSPDLRLAGIDERTALVWSDGQWTVLGAGTVTVVTAATRQTYAAGTTVDLPSPDR